jgi:predicted site-specific integrase-resolvase
MQENKIKLSEPLMTMKEVTAKLRISKQTLNKYCKAKKIIPIKVSERKFLYDAVQIEAFINNAKFGKQK